MTKSCFVTGGSSGIGREIVLAFAAQGYDVAFVHLHDDENAEAVAKEATSACGRACPHLSVDLADDSGPARAAEFALETLGAVHVLANNAGITRFQPTLELTAEITDRLYRTNFRAPLLLAQLIAREMVEQGTRGSIVNTASTRGLRAYPGDAVYGGLKAALIRASESMALDLAPYGIRVNCVAPGAIQVRQTESVNQFYETFGKEIPLGRAGRPSDVARAVLWLASDEAEYVTGTTLKVDGGLILPGWPEH